MSPGDGRGPGAPHAGPDLTTTDTTTRLGNGSTAQCTDVHSIVGTSPRWHVIRDAAAVRAWCAPLLGNGAPPLLGSPEWLAADGPTRLASLTRAAMTWLDSCSDQSLTVELTVQIARERDDTIVRLRELSHDLSGALDWSATDRGVSFAHIQERRAVVKVPR